MRKPGEETGMCGSPFISHCSRSLVTGNSRSSCVHCTLVHLYTVQPLSPGKTVWKLKQIQPRFFQAFQQRPLWFDKTRQIVLLRQTGLKYLCIYYQVSLSHWPPSFWILFVEGHSLWGSFTGMIFLCKENLKSYHATWEICNIVWPPG